MFEKWKEKISARNEKKTQARESFASWLDISKSTGWKVYEERVNREIELIESKMSSDINLSGEDLKRLQLALQVWKKVQRIPKDLEDNAKRG